MSARTEQLVTEITALEEKIAQEPAGSSNVNMLREHLHMLQQQLTSATEALNENRQVLKG